MVTHKRNTSFGVIALTLLFLGGLLAAPAHGQSSGASESLIIRDLPAKVRLAPGQRVRVTLPTNVTTGYTWFADGGCCTSGNKPVVKISKGKYQASDNPQGLVGAPGETTWTIRALRPGRTTVNIITRPPGAQNTMQDETVGTVRITVGR